MLRDRRFYLVLPLYVAPPFLLTGMFFHQIVLADERGWSLALLAGAFSLYAGMKIAASLVSGIVVDRITALRALPFSAIPLILAFASLLLPPDTFGIYAPFVYLGLCGLNLGMIGPVSGGLWPELFGTGHLGAIRSLTSPIAIFATAAAPFCSVRLLMPVSIFRPSPLAVWVLSALPHCLPLPRGAIHS